MMNLFPPKPYSEKTKPRAKRTTKTNLDLNIKAIESAQDEHFQMKSQWKQNPDSHYRNEQNPVSNLKLSNNETHSGLILDWA